MGIGGLATAADSAIQMPLKALLRYNLTLKLSIKITNAVSETLLNNYTLTLSRLQALIYIISSSRPNFAAAFTSISRQQTYICSLFMILLVPCFALCP